MVNPVGLVQGLALFFLGGAIAYVLPRPLQEDKRVTARVRHRRSVNSKTPRDKPLHQVKPLLPRKR